MSGKNLLQASTDATGHTQLTGPDNTALNAKGVYATSGPVNISYLGELHSVCRLPARYMPTGSGYSAISRGFNRARGTLSGSATFGGLAPFSVR